MFVKRTCRYMVRECSLVGMVAFFLSIILSTNGLKLKTVQAQEVSSNITTTSSIPYQLVDARRHLRRLTLDLWGTLPSEEALLSQAPEQALSEAQVREILSHPKAQRFFRRFNAERFWPALGLGDIVNEAISLLLPASFYGDTGPHADRLFLIFTGIYQRGGFVPCSDEPVEYDENGELIFEEYPDGTQREGFTWVTPYWSDEAIKVCALEARAMESGIYGGACDETQGLLTGECGCGASLERCMSIESAQVFLKAFQEQMEYMALEHSGAAGYEARSYFDLFTRQDELVNGPLVHYYRYIAPMVLDPMILQAPSELDSLPLLDFSNRETWVWVDRRSDLHSGILTSLTYLLRFPTARSRANRVSTQLLCTPFVASSDRLPAPEDPCSQNPNLSERCGCSDCHSRLEPLAAYWGRFADNGSLFLDPDDFPSFDAECARCADPNITCSERCRQFYVHESFQENGLEIPDDYLGVLKSYEWRNREEIRHIEQGPKALFAQRVNQVKLARCTTEHLFKTLISKEATQGDWIRLEHYVSRFLEHQNLAELTYEILSDPAYLDVDQAELP